MVTGCVYTVMVDFLLPSFGDGKTRPSHGAVVA